MNYEPGLLVAGRYRLEEVIATGGMGQVWRAVDETLQRPVAVKVLRPDTAGEEGFLERFRAEARHSAALQHPNIATVHDFGEGEHTAYLVMELIEGQPLSTIIKDRAPLPPDETTEILFQAAIALQAAHDAGVVHRDVKPANIVVDDEGYARLTDFGISRALAGAQLTQTGEVLGTPHYLAPEQAQGRPAGPASDVYALAVVGYEMITGRRPFAGDSMITTALAHVSQPVPPLPHSVPEPLRTTVMAGLAKDPSRRPESAAAFSEALRMPAGTAPAYLVAGAASAVAPVVVGVPGTSTLSPEMGEPTTFLPTAAPNTPALPAAAAPRVATVDTRRRWLLPLTAAVGALVVVLVLAVTSAVTNHQGAPRRPATPVSRATSAAAPAPTTPRAPTTTPATAQVTAPAAVPAGARSSTQAGPVAKAPAPSAPPARVPAAGTVQQGKGGAGAGQGGTKGGTGTKGNNGGKGKDRGKKK